MADPMLPRPRFDPKNGSVNLGGRPYVKEPEHARVWRAMDGDDSVRSFFTCLNLTPNEINVSINCLRASGIKNLRQLLESSSQVQKEWGLELRVILKISTVAHGVLTELQWLDAEVTRVLRAARSGGLVLYECEATDVSGQAVPITRWLPANAIPKELQASVGEAASRLPLTFNKRGKDGDLNTKEITPKKEKRGRPSLRKTKENDEEDEVEQKKKKKKKMKRSPGRPKKVNTEWEVAEIMGEEIRDGQKHYLVRWEDFPNEVDFTFEPLSHLAENLRLQEYKARLKAAKASAASPRGKKREADDDSKSKRAPPSPTKQSPVRPMEEKSPNELRKPASPASKQSPIRPKETLAAVKSPKEEKNQVIASPKNKGGRPTKEESKARRRLELEKKEAEKKVKEAQKKEEAKKQRTYAPDDEERSDEAPKQKEEHDDYKPLRKSPGRPRMSERSSPRPKFKESSSLSDVSSEEASQNKGRRTSFRPHKK